MASRTSSWLLVLSLLVAACTSGHDALSNEVEEAGFEDRFDFLVERRVGPEQCFAGDCPAITRYYLSDEDAAQTCLAVEELLEGTNVSTEPTLGDETCRYLGSIGDTRLDVRATDPITEIPPDDQTLNPFAVTDPHAAVVVVRATRDA